MKNIFFFILLTLNLSCKENKPLTELTVIANEETKINTQQMSYIDPEKVKNWSLEQIKEKYKPITEEDFLLNEAIISEFRIRLYNFFNEKERKQPILIKEITWKKDKDTNYTIWYKKNADKWVFIDSFIWGKDWVF